MNKINTIVIAAGGKSERLAEYFKSINFHNTKTLFPIKQTKPSLGYLIDAAIKNHFERIFVLSGFYDKKIKHFIDQYYKDKDIIIVSSEVKSEGIGVTKDLSLIENDLDGLFIYSDGDIIFESNLLGKLSAINFDNNFLINCVVSPEDMALTHSQFIIESGVLTDINVRCDGLTDKTNNTLCSLGLMVMSNEVFRQIPEYKNIGDLDLVVKKVFKTNHQSVGFYLYEGEWISIHKKEDLDKIKNGYYSIL